MAVLVAARVLQGLGAGAIPAIAYTSVGRAYPPAIRPRVFAVFSSAWVIPGLVGPAAASAHRIGAVVAGGLLGDPPAVLLAGVITLPALRAAEIPPPPRGRRSRRRPHRPIVVLAAGAALVMAAPQVGAPVARRRAGRRRACRWPSWAFLRLVPVGTIRVAAGLPAAVAVRGLLTFAFFGTDAFIPLAVTDGRGQDTWVAGLALTVGTVMWTIAAWVQQHRVHTDGPRRLVTIGLGVTMAGICAGQLLVHGAPIPLGIACWGLAGFGVGLAYAPLSVTVLGLATPGSEGRATSSLQLSDTLGVALGTGATGAIVDFGDGRDWFVGSSLSVGFAITAAVAVVGAVAARRLPKHLPS